ncbi:MAG: sulfotransferase domain-containing protein [Caldilineaceae bacterium]
MVPYAEWVVTWHRNADPQRGLVIRYEDLVQQPECIMSKVAHHFSLPNDSQTIQSIVDAYRFERLSQGRKPGQQSTQSFFRKGIAGDWQMHFTPKVVDSFKHKIGDYLIHFGYERDFAW